MSDEKTRSDVPRLEFLDSLRGAGALAVAGQHFGAVYPMYSWTDSAFNAKLAVSLFFVMSGYVLSYRHFSSPRLELDLPKYLVARFCRLWLPFVGAVFLALALQRYAPHYIGTDPAMSQDIVAKWATIPGLGSQGGVLDQIDPRHFLSPVLVAPSWTLMAEMAASLLLPLYLLLARQGFLWLAMFLYMTYMGNANGAWILSFAMGVCLARNIDVVKRNSTRPLRIGYLVLFAAAYVFNLPGRLPNSEYLVWGVLSLGLVGAFLTSPTLRKIGNHPIPAYLGKISFGTYLLHWPILCSIGPILFVYLNRMNIFGAAAWWTTLTLILVLTLIAASLFYPVVERTSIIGGKKLGTLASWLVSRAAMLIPERFRTPSIGT